MVNAIFLFQIISGVTALLVRDSLVHGILNGSGKMGWGSWGPKFPRHPNILCTKRQRSTGCLFIYNYQSARGCENQLEGAFVEAGLDVALFEIAADGRTRVPRWGGARRGSGDISGRRPDDHPETNRLRCSNTLAVVDVLLRDRWPVDR